MYHNVCSHCYHNVCCLIQGYVCIQLYVVTVNVGLYQDQYSRLVLGQCLTGQWSLFIIQPLVFHVESKCLLLLCKKLQYAVVLLICNKLQNENLHTVFIFYIPVSMQDFKTKLGCTALFSASV